MLYEKTFSLPDNQTQFRSDILGNASPRSRNFKWKHRLDEDLFYDFDVEVRDDFGTDKEYLEHKKWFEDRLKKRPHQKRLYRGHDGDSVVFAFRLGDVWLGSR